MKELQQEALQRAVSSPSVANYGAIFAGFAEKGIAVGDIKPRENVFTFHAWKALGRVVRKGEHGVKVCTWVEMSKKDDAGNAQPIGRKPRMTTVFHVSQTEAIEGAKSAQVVQEAKPVQAKATAKTPDAAIEFQSDFVQM